MKRHTLKCHTIPFEEIWESRKTHESRVNDRGYAVDDVLELVETDGERPTGRRIVADVTYISNEWNSFGAVNRGYVVMSLGGDMLFESDS